MNNYIIYSRPHCTFCDQAKSLIESKGHTYQEVIIGENITKEEFLEMFPGQRTVPVVILDGQNIGGYTELTEQINKQFLKG